MAQAASGEYEKKILVLSATGFEIDGFDAKAMCTSKELTAFEFLFGLGKSWAEKFPCLKFASKNEDDEVN